MAILRFNTNNLHMDIIIGINEKFEPKESIIEANSKAVELKHTMVRFLDDTFKTVDVQEVNKIINEDKELESKWRDFLTNIYKPELQIIVTEVTKINKEICNNYSDFITE